MQLMYYIAFTETGYPVDADHLPESMNEGKIGIEHAIHHLIEQKFNIRHSKTDVSFSVDHDWPHGFEESLRRGPNLYNSGNRPLDWYYGGKVWYLALNYEPER